MEGALKLTRDRTPKVVPDVVVNVPVTLEELFSGTTKVSWPHQFTNYHVVCREVLADVTLQDVSVPVETKNSGGRHMHEHRKLTLDIERGWANGTVLKFAKRLQDVTGDIVVKLQQVLKL